MNDAREPFSLDMRIVFIHRKWCHTPDRLIKLLTLLVDIQPFIARASCVGMCRPPYYNILTIIIIIICSSKANDGMPYRRLLLSLSTLNWKCYNQIMWAYSSACARCRQPYDNLNHTEWHDNDYSLLYPFTFTFAGKKLFIARAHVCVCVAHPIWCARTIMLKCQHKMPLKCSNISFMFACNHKCWFFFLVHFCRIKKENEKCRNEMHEHIVTHAKHRKF